MFRSRYPIVPLCSLCSLCLSGSIIRADPPVASYVFPAGGQRGTIVPVKVGGLFLYDRCGFEMLGEGITAPAELRRTDTLWIEGPLLPIPDSQRQEDYPKDMAGRLAIAADAAPGPRGWRVRTSQGVTAAKVFVVGDLPEIVETELPGDPIPGPVTLPLTVNGRMFPNEDVDVWAVSLKKGRSVTAVVEAARIGSPLDARLEVHGPDGRPLAENDDSADADPALRFTAAADGVHEVRIHDINFKGSQAHVYRLTLTADPYVDHVFPLGGRRGTRTAFRLSGQGLPEGPQNIDIPAGGASPFLHRIDVGGKKTNAFTLDVDDLPEIVEGKDSALPVPGIANGRIAQPGESDRFRFTARRGDAIDLELRARSLGSPLTGVLAIEDDKGRVMQRVEPGTRPDTAMRFTAPADGTYIAVVAERFRSLGGPEYAYRLRITPAGGADFVLRLKTDALTVLRGGQLKLQVSVEAVGGFKQPIALRFEGLPDGVTVTGTALKAGQATANLMVLVSATAKAGVFPVALRGTANVDGKEVTRTAVAEGDWPTESLRLGVGLAAPFKVVGKYEMGWAARGSVAKRSYTVERDGYDGPLTVRLADRQARHLQGVTGPTITVPAGASEFEYPVTLPPWMEIGRTCRVCVVAEGVVREPDGSTHVVSFSSVNQNEQLVAVIEAGYLDLAAEVTSARAEPGKDVSVPVRLRRGKGLDGPVKLELLMPGHVRGVSAPAVVIPADRSAGALAIRFEAGAGPFNMPLTLRATLTSPAGPVTAEARIDVAPAMP